MQRQDALDPPMIDGNLVAGLDDPGEFTGGEGMCEGQADNLVLDRPRDTLFQRGFATGMRERPVVEEADKARLLKAAEITPEAVIRQTRRLTLLAERPVALEDGTEHLIAG